MSGASPVPVAEVYDRHGVVWAGLRGEAPAEGAWLDRFCDRLAPGASVLDLGCGSGVPIARELARRGFAVTGVDASTTMLDMFRRNLPDRPALLIDMRHFPVDRPFGGVLAWDSFFHLAPGDQPAMLARFVGLAAVGAPVLFTSGDREGVAIGELDGEPLFHGSLAPDHYRACLAAAGLEVVAHTANDPDCGNRTVWLARRIAGPVTAD